MISQSDSQNEIKKEITAMYGLIREQWTNCKVAFLSNDLNASSKIIEDEKKINSLEIKIDQSCERLIALHTPVAIDLRFVLSMLKINTYLERVGDNIEGIAHSVIAVNKGMSEEVSAFFQLHKLLSAMDDMFDKVELALVNEDTEIAREVKDLDLIINSIDKENRSLAQDFVQNHPAELQFLLHILSVTRKIERLGDLLKNVGEEIVFYKEALVLKHKGNKAKKKEIKEVLRDE